MKDDHSTATRQPEGSPRRYRDGLETLTYSVWEAARVLGIGRDTCYSLIHTNKLKAIRVGVTGSRWRVPRSEVEAFVKRELERPQ
jgi:excisionase family DNA binding protein